MQRLRSPDPVSSTDILDQGPRGDGLKKGIVLEKRRLSQKRISELSQNFNTNSTNAKEVKTQLREKLSLGNNKGSISANNSVSKSKRSSIDPAHAGGMSSDEARQLYCRIDSRKNSQSSVQNN